MNKSANLSFNIITAINRDTLANVLITHLNFRTRDNSTETSHEM